MFVGLGVPLCPCKGKRGVCKRGSPSLWVWG